MTTVQIRSHGALPKTVGDVHELFSDIRRIASSRRMQRLDGCAAQISEVAFYP